MKEFFKRIRALIYLLLIVSIVLDYFWKTAVELKIDPIVVISANLILFAFSVVNIYFQSRNIHNPNPNAVIRGVMAGMFLKLFGLAAAAVIYLFAAGGGRSVNALFVSMGLYILYTWLEVRISLQLNPKK
jgi:hypothetical protein